MDSTQAIQFCKISIFARDDITPPFFIGSQIRGALGYALKSIVCAERQGDCKGCKCSDSCAYFDCYERKNVYHNFRLDFKLGMPRYDFSLYLFGEALENAPIFIASLHKMLCEMGLKSSGNKLLFKDIIMLVNDRFCFCGGDIQMPLEFGQTFVINDFATNVKLRLITPLRIKKHNLFIRNGCVLELRYIINSIYQRKLAILGKERARAGEFSGKILSQNLRYIETYRKSSTQQTNMNLGGLMGEIIVRDLDKQSYELLKLGELIGVGKQCAFGLGKIEIL